MVFLGALGAFAVLAVVFGPAIWARGVLAWHDLVDVRVRSYSPWLAEHRAEHDVRFQIVP